MCRQENLTLRFIKLNLNNKTASGFTLIEMLLGLLLSSGVIVGLTFLMSDIFNQLSYEDVNQKVQSYGNYVLDDISESFKLNNIEDISIGNYDGYSIIRVNFPVLDNNSEIKYSIDAVSGAINKNNEPIHANNNTLNQYFNDFENKNYSILVSEFSCSDLNSAGSTERYGSRPFDGSNFRSSLYIIDMQVEIYKKIKDELRLYNVVDFQRTVFVNDEFI